MKSNKHYNFRIDFTDGCRIEICRRTIKQLWRFIDTSGYYRYEIKSIRFFTPEKHAPRHRLISKVRQDIKWRFYKKLTTLRW